MQKVGIGGSVDANEGEYRPRVGVPNIVCFGVGNGSSHNEKDGVKGGNIDMGDDGVVGDLEEQGERHGDISIDLFASEVDIGVNCHHRPDLDVGWHRYCGSKPYSSISWVMNVQNIS